MESSEVRRWWAERAGEYSPDYYAHYGPDETSESVRSIVDRVLSPDASILELGCSSGRHLAHLQEHGYDDLAGIEVNDDAFDVMAETYPDVAATGTFYDDAIEAVVDELPDGRFDVVYSVETLQHLHPDAAWVYDEIARITDELLVTVENEGNTADPRGQAGGVGRDRGESRPSDGGTGSTSDPKRVDGDAVSYVNGELPLYYRDWAEIFTERGFESVAIEDGERSVVHDVDTVRAFRPTGESDTESERVR